MAQSVLTQFVENPFLVLLNSCSKEDLFVVAARYNIQVSRQLLKAELREVVVSELVRLGVFVVEEAVAVESADVKLDAACPADPPVSAPPPGLGAHVLGSLCF